MRLRIALAVAALGLALPSVAGAAPSIDEARNALLPPSALHGFVRTSWQSATVSGWTSDLAAVRPYRYWVTQSYMPVCDGCGTTLQLSVSLAGSPHAARAMVDQWAATRPGQFTRGDVAIGIGDGGVSWGTKAADQRGPVLSLVAHVAVGSFVLDATLTRARHWFPLYPPFRQVLRRQAHQIGRAHV